MTQMQTEIFRGKEWDKIIQEIQKEYERFEIKETKTSRPFPWIFKEYTVTVSGLQKGYQDELKTMQALKAMQQLKEEENRKKNEQKHTKTRVEYKQEELDEDQEEILSLLDKKSVNKIKNNKIEMMKKEGHDEESIESMKKMIENIVTKIETKNKGFLEDENEKVLLRYYEILKAGEVDSELAKKMMMEIRRNIKEEDYTNKELIEEQLLKNVESKLKVTGALDLKSIKTMALIGPTGVGKTTTLAKIAGILRSQNKRIGLITTDVYRIGATDQLQIYANILGCKMIAATNPQELKDAIDYFRNVEKTDQILIDTVGRSPMNVNLINDIKEYLDIAKPDHTGLVLSSTQKYSDVLKIINNFKHVSVNSVLFTKLDETMSYGTMLNIAAKSDLKISYITDGQNVPQDIYVATAEILAKKILNGVDEYGSSSIIARVNE